MPVPRLGFKHLSIQLSFDFHEIAIWEQFATTFTILNLNIFSNSVSVLEMNGTKFSQIRNRLSWITIQPWSVYSIHYCGCLWLPFPLLTSATSHFLVFPCFRASLFLPLSCSFWIDSALSQCLPHGPFPLPSTLPFFSEVKRDPRSTRRRSGEHCLGSASGLLHSLRLLPRVWTHQQHWDQKITIHV